MKLDGLLVGTRRSIGSGQILLSGADGFDGYEITAYHGMVWGLSVRAKDVGQDCAMGCKQITGGELSSYTSLGDESRQRCLDRMMEMAARLQANAIINVRFELFGAAQGASQVTVYGTAVTISPIGNYVPGGAVGNILVELVNAMEKRP
jgi:uncharacterized protein YbjQ (UPF0145 family)